MMMARLDKIFKLLAIKVLEPTVGEVDGNPPYERKVISI